MLSNGTGEFDSERLLEELPSALHLPERKVSLSVRSLSANFY